MKDILNDESVQRRLLAKTEDRDQCRIFVGAVGQNGYGKIWDGERAESAHRVAYRAFVGPIPEDFHVCHRCDVKQCVLPEHLFLDSQAGNVADMYAKGREARGEKLSAAIKGSWTEERRARQAENASQRAARVLAEKRASAGVDDQHWPCSDCGGWFHHARTGRAGSYCPDCNRKRASERMRVSRARRRGSMGQSPTA